MTEFEVEETKTKKKVKTENVKSKNLKEFAVLKDEFRKGRMPPTKKVALVTKLTGLYLEGKLDEEETLLMRDILTQDRIGGKLSNSLSDILNKIEVEECEDKCFVKNPNAPTVLNLKYMAVCNYKFESARGRYIVYVPIEIPGEFQLSMAAARKYEKGLELDAHEIPATRVIYRRLDIKQKEFDAWFGYDEEILLGNKVKEQEEYNF